MHADPRLTMTTRGTGTFGELLRVHRLPAGLTRDELAERETKPVDASSNVGSDGC